MKKILIPFDFSPEAEFAVDVGQQIASVSDAELELLHVIEQFGESFSSMGEMTETDSEYQVYTLKLIEAMKNKLNNMITQPSFEGIKVAARVEVGNAFKHVSQSIATDNFDLVVMGSKGASGLKELVIGSNAEKVIRHSKAPVLIIKQKTDISTLKNIVLAIDFDDELHYNIEAVKSLQKLLGARLHLLYVNTPANWQLTRKVNQREQAFADKYGLEDYTLNNYNAAFPELGIACFATDINADMIGIATHGKTGFAHLMDGSIAEDIANHQSKPILTFTIK